MTHEKALPAWVMKEMIKNGTLIFTENLVTSPAEMGEYSKTRPDWSGQDIAEYIVGHLTLKSAEAVSSRPKLTELLQSACEVGLLQPPSELR